MPYPNLDALFYIASSGNFETYLLLHNEVVKKANIVLSEQLSKYSKYVGNHVDFSDFIEDLFLKINNEYDADRCSYSWYVNKMLILRISTEIKTKIKDINVGLISLDKETDDGKTYLDSIEDKKYSSLGTEIAIKDFKYSICSPGTRKTRKESKIRKVLMMKYVGYTDKEICEKLNITIGVLRGIYKKYNEDDKMLDFKLELK